MAAVRSVPRNRCGGRQRGLERQRRSRPQDHWLESREWSSWSAHAGPDAGGDPLGPLTGPHRIIAGLRPAAPGDILSCRSFDGVNIKLMKCGGIRKPCG